jgi:hypothetical protein
MRQQQLRARPLIAALLRELGLCNDCFQDRHG